MKNFLNTNQSSMTALSIIAFSKKKQVLERCMLLKKPFALLLPIDTLERQYMAELFNDGNFQVLIPKNRYAQKNVPYKSVWLCWRLPLISNYQIIYE